MSSNIRKLSKRLDRLTPTTPSVNFALQKAIEQMTREEEFELIMANRVIKEKSGATHSFRDEYLTEHLASLPETRQVTLAAALRKLEEAR